MGGVGWVGVAAAAGCLCTGRQAGWLAGCALQLAPGQHAVGLGSGALVQLLLSTQLRHTAAEPYPTPPSTTHQLPDKSVFEFYAMDEAGQRARLEQLRLELCAYDADEPTERFKLDELNRELENL